MVGFISPQSTPWFLVLCSWLNSNFQINMLLNWPLWLFLPVEARTKLIPFLANIWLRLPLIRCQYEAILHSLPKLDLLEYTFSQLWISPRSDQQSYFRQLRCSISSVFYPCQFTVKTSFLIFHISVNYYSESHMVQKQNHPIMESYFMAPEHLTTNI